MMLVIIASMGIIVTVVMLIMVMINVVIMVLIKMRKRILSGPEGDDSDEKEKYTDDKKKITINLKLNPLKDCRNCKG